MNPSPPVSVVMPVYNALPWLDESIGSILGQDDGDFEFVILDDGSTDGSRAGLREWAARDGRIRIIESDVRLGPVGSSNRVVAESRAPLIARMDADDLSRPDRLRRQRGVLEACSDAVLVGSLGESIDASGRVVRGTDYPRLLRASRFAPFAHPTIMFRRAAFECAGGYRDAAAMWEDVDLYLRMAGVGRVFTIGEPLVRIRHWQGNTRTSGAATDLEEAMERMYDLLEGPRRPPDGKIRPQALVAAGSVALWAGRSPHALRAMRSRAALGWDRPSLKALVWAAWADVSPRTLRFVLARILAWRSRRARRALGGATLFEWQPGDKPRALEPKSAFGEAER